MALEVKCGNCKHKGSRRICEGPESPRFKQKVELTDRCDFYAESLAQGRLKEASIKSLADHSTAGIEDFKKAIELGLPEDDEMFARLHLASGYADVAVATKDELSVEQLVASVPYLEALKHTEKAISIDRQGQYGFFSEPLNRALLRPFDEFYNLTGLVLKDSEGIEPAVTYLQQKIGMLSYLPSTPLLLTTLTLGNLYLEKDQKENSAACYRNIVNSEPVLRGDETRNEPAIRREATEKLQQINSSKSGCFVATVVYGSEEASEVIWLREFRDEILSHWVSGRVFIRAYNFCGPILSRIIVRSDFLKSVVRISILRPAISFTKLLAPNRN
jgi:hypothetical protein